MGYLSTEKVRDLAGSLKAESKIVDSISNPMNAGAKVSIYYLL